MTQRLVDIEIIWVGSWIKALFYACRMREHVNDVGSILCLGAAHEKGVDAIAQAPMESRWVLWMCMLLFWDLRFEQCILASCWMSGTRWTKQGISRFCVVSLCRLAMMVEQMEMQFTG